MAIAFFCFDHIVNTIYTISIFPFCDFHILRDKFIEEIKNTKKKSIIHINRKRQFIKEFSDNEI